MMHQTYRVRVIKLAEWKCFAASSCHFYQNDPGEIVNQAFITPSVIDD
jgi:hypothetical protein